PCEAFERGICIVEWLPKGEVRSKKACLVCRKLPPECRCNSTGRLAKHFPVRAVRPRLNSGLLSAVSRDDLIALELDSILRGLRLKRAYDTRFPIDESAVTIECDDVERFHHGIFPSIMQCV